MKSRQQRRSRARQRGYNLVELMMSIALLTVGILGIISMQKITVVANSQARNVALARSIAQSWAGQLEMDATAWRTTFGTGFLNNAAAWQRPVAARGFGAAFDGFGNALGDTPTELSKARFCTHVRMSWLYPTTLGVGGNGMLRAEVRVFWLRDGQSPLDTTVTMCSAAQTAAQAQSIGLSTDRYWFLYQTVGVRQHFQI